MKKTADGRFDRSFVIRMLREFFFVLVAIALMEMTVRLGLVFYEFETKDEQTTVAAAERLASNLKDVMLNAGGPVAARTIYPTWRQNFEDLGMEVALIPAHVTRTSIEKTYGFTPKGIPPSWSEGRHHEARVALKAEPFCIRCHVDADPGDVLGEVVVRTYRSARMRSWWDEVGVLSIVSMADIIASTLVLFFLLRARMEPLLALRAMLANLARGKLDLSYRAEVRSEDEFGALASDLNHFLDRITHVIEDLDHILSRMVASKHRLDQVSAQLTEHFSRIHDQTQEAVRQVYGQREAYATLSRELAEAVEIIDVILATLELLREEGMIPEAYQARIADLRARFAAAAVGTEPPAPPEVHAMDVLLDLSRRVHASSHFLESMASLQERMEVIAETGQVLLSRLSSEEAPPEDTPPEAGAEDTAAASRPFHAPDPL
ncbi:HAMP domain-containing protein [Rhodocaloribacter sp.]